MRAIILLSFISIFFCNLSYSQNTVGLISYTPGNSEGYVLFTPMSSGNTYLIDKCGNKAHEWNSSSYKPALSTYLLEDGTLLKTGQSDNPEFQEGGSGGVIEHFDWNGNLQWRYSISDSNQCLHHDITPMPNGNILCIVWEKHSKENAVLNGKDNSYQQAYLWSEKIVELQPIGSDSAAIVWEWKLFDHLIQDYDASKSNYGIVSEHPELVDINYFPGAGNTSDWIHLNSIDYHPELDQILLSSHRFNELWIIDHSTSTSEAASHSGGNAGKGGDLLYRWGNPQAYQRGNPSTKVFYGQHHANWIPSGYPRAGQIMVFNNGLNRPGTYSSVDIIEPPLNASNSYDVPTNGSFLPAALNWSYTAENPSDFYSSNISGAYPLENGSFMITSGANGLFFEIDSMKQILWEYVNPVDNSGILSQGDSPSGNMVFRCNFYPSDYSGLQGQTLTPQGEIELNPSEPTLCDSFLIVEKFSTNEQSIVPFPNPFHDNIRFQHPSEEPVHLVLHDYFGKQILQRTFTKSIELNTTSLSCGIYYFRLTNSEGHLQQGLMVKE